MQFHEIRSVKEEEDAKVRLKKHRFTGSLGMKVSVHDYNNPRKIFEQFFTGDLINLIVCETSRYAEQILSKNRPLQKHSRLKFWTPNNKQGMRNLIIFFLLQGIVWKPWLMDYFTLHPLLEIPEIQNIFSFNRLVLLQKFLHFVDNENTSE